MDHIVHGTFKNYFLTAKGKVGLLHVTCDHHDTDLDPVEYADKCTEEPEYPAICSYERGSKATTDPALNYAVW